MKKMTVTLSQYVKDDEPRMNLSYPRDATEEQLYAITLNLVYLLNKRGGCLNKIFSEIRNDLTEMHKEDQEKEHANN